MAIDRETITHDEWCALPVEERQAIYAVAALKRAQVPGAGYGGAPVGWCSCCGDESGNTWACGPCWDMYCFDPDSYVPAPVIRDDLRRQAAAPNTIELKRRRFRGDE